MRDQRAEEFARCAVVLAAQLRETRRESAVAADLEEQADPFAAPAPTDNDPFAPAMAGREGVFDQALSNGLAAIVASEWPGNESDRQGRVLSASALPCWTGCPREASSRGKRPGRSRLLGTHRIIESNM
ncbi:hypothetical protein [Streptomyces sp. 1222.5]|uniref:hypothetical protein n=1 Tax=Streptomyces sp. 1222.5 TaxID=1881026 RepID=UPI003D754F44